MGVFFYNMSVECCQFSFYTLDRCQNRLPLVSSRSSEVQVHTRQLRLALPSSEVKPVGPLHNGTTSPGLCVGSAGQTGCHAPDAHARAEPASSSAALTRCRNRSGAHTGVYSHHTSVSRPCRHRSCLLFFKIPDRCCGLGSWSVFFFMAS